MKIAYLLLVHDQPWLTAQLVNTIASPENHIFIHVDAKSNEEAFRQALSTQNKIHFIKERTHCLWGRYSLVNATLTLVKEASSRTFDPFDYYILLSGHDFPIKSNSYISTFLKQHIGTDFIEHFALPSERINEKQGGLYRVNRYHYYSNNHPKEFPPYSKKPLLNPLFNSLAYLYQLTFRKMPLGMKPYAGSQWWMLCNETIKSLLAFLQDNPTIESFFNNVWIPDEIFLQTVILHIKSEAAFKNNYRYVQWNKGQNNNAASTPSILTLEHFNLLMESDALFARKFDEIKSKELIEKLQEDLSFSN